MPYQKATLLRIRKSRCGFVPYRRIRRRRSLRPRPKSSSRLPLHERTILLERHGRKADGRRIVVEK